LTTRRSSAALCVLSSVPPHWSASRHWRTPSRQTINKDKDELDIGSLFAGGDDKASQDEDITELLSHAGAAYISTDKDLLGQEERERSIFDECRRYRREHPNEAKSACHVLALLCPQICADAPAPPLLSQAPKVSLLLCYLP
jgi:hypothetical protein